MDGQNFENENNVTVDTTAAETVSEAEVHPAAEPVQETPVVKPVNNSIAMISSGAYGTY